MKITIDRHIDRQTDRYTHMRDILRNWLPQLQSLANPKSGGTVGRLENQGRADDAVKPEGCTLTELSLALPVGWVWGRGAVC